MNQSKVDDIKKAIREIPDFPKKGINFYDITTLLRDGNIFKDVINIFYEKFRDRNIDYVVSIEARGFIFGSALAYKLGAGFVPIRKKGKLPAKTAAVTYDLEYGQDTLEIHEDAVESGKNIIIVDDVLATGGTVLAAADLCTKTGANVISAVFLMELEFLQAKSKLDGLPYFALLGYSS